MKHLGDITKIDGTKIEPVWCITGGSPCQDLSVAGKRAGLDGARSGLFMEQIRIVKEMRSIERHIDGADEPVRLPRYMVWENVPGAFSSNNGEDFLTVLEEVCRIAEPDFRLPRPESKQGKIKWSKSGVIDLDWGQVAWRIHDAQYFGVPQRRRRICICADYNGHTAADIIAELVGDAGDPSRKQTFLDTARQSTDPTEVQSQQACLSGHPQTGGEQGKRVAGDTEKSLGDGSKQLEDPF